MKDSKNIGGRFAVLEFGGEWMQKDIVLRAVVVNFQGVIDYKLELG